MGWFRQFQWCGTIKKKLNKIQCDLDISKRYTFVQNNQYLINVVTNVQTHFKKVINDYKSLDALNSRAWPSVTRTYCIYNKINVMHQCSPSSTFTPKTSSNFKQKKLLTKAKNYQQLSNHNFMCECVCVCLSLLFIRGNRRGEGESGPNLTNHVSRYQKRKRDFTEVTQNIINYIKNGILHHSIKKIASFNSNNDKI